MRHFAVLPFLLAAILVASTFAVAPSADAMSRHRAKKFANAMDIVRAQKGDRYNYGSAGPRQFDCSGLVYYSFRKAGFRKVPRTSDAQARYTYRVKRRNMHRGDLVFFHNGGNVYHVGVYAGRDNGRRYIIHAPYGDKRVHRAPIWTNSWFAGSMRNPRRL
jgi:cell wall-associated NlpC family hydrolase